MSRCAPRELLVAMLLKSNHVTAPTVSWERDCAGSRRSPDKKVVQKLHVPRLEVDISKASRTVTMDPRKLTELLRATIEPSQQKQAEEQLNQVKIQKNVLTTQSSLFFKSFVFWFAFPNKTTIKKSYCSIGFKISHHTWRSWPKGACWIKSKNLPAQFYEFNQSWWFQRFHGYGKPIGKV